MKISLRWLRRYIELNRTIEEIEDALTLIGFEVEGVERIGVAPMDHVVVGEVVSSEQHPNADRLSVCAVQTSLAEEPRTIVCGAKNYRVGDRVIVALPGAELPGGFHIRESKLRGVLSQGMMCSARELGIGESHEGILVLEHRPQVGLPIEKAFPEGDVIFDIEVTPNRPDCLSHIGIARELGAYFREPVVYPEVRSSTHHPFGRSGLQILEEVRSETADTCPHYRAYCIRGVKVGPSPADIRTALEAIGLRSINNVVDVTNFVLHELGQPLHAFDLNKVRGGRIIVRMSRPGESIALLDGKTRTLDERVTVIADGERAIAIAGVMGGSETEVDDNTTDIVLEAAWFAPTNVRATSRRLGVSTDSSYRFERGVDPKGTEYAALRAVDLIVQHAGGELVGQPFVDGSPPIAENEITISPDFVRERIGFEVTNDAIREAYESLDCNVRVAEDGEGRAVFHVGTPSYRLDLQRRVDLVEEFLRMHGTSNIPGSRAVLPAIVAHDSAIAQFQRSAGTYLVENGFFECMHYSMRSHTEIKRWFSHAAADSLGLANPLASDQTHLRPSLLPGLLDALKLNRNRRNTLCGLFESGRVFRERDGRLWELLAVDFVLPAHAGDPEWADRIAPDYHHVYGLIQGLLQLANVNLETIAEPVPLVGLDPWQEGHTAQLGRLEEGFLARYGLLSVPLVREWELEGRVFAGSVMFLPEFLERRGSRAIYRPISQYPDASRDLALVVDRSISAERVRRDLITLAREIVGAAFVVESVRIFDVYVGNGIPEGTKSLAFTIRFRSQARTLKDDEVAGAFQKIQDRIVKERGYAIRS